MNFPTYVIANADDFGLNKTVNCAIAECFDKGFINSTSLMTNTAGFAEAVELAHQNRNIRNIGVHINLAEGKPITNVGSEYLDISGNWDVAKTGKLLKLLSAADKAMFVTEINAQIAMINKHKVTINHLDSHYHLHTLPAFNALFISAAKQHGLKLRLAQTYNEGSLIKYAYRKLINNKLIKAGFNYSYNFETVHKFLANRHKHNGQLVEVMLHPDKDHAGDLTDSYDEQAMVKWLAFINETI